MSAVFTFGATLALVLIGFGQKRISADQAKIMRRQRKLAVEQTSIIAAQARTTQMLSDLERPALLVRYVEGVAFAPLPDTAPESVGHCLPITRIEFANYGRTPGILIGIEGGIIVVGGIPPEPDYQGRTRRELRLQVVEPGEGKGISARIEGRLVTKGEAHLAQADQLLTIVFGRLIYRDAFGDRAASGFGYLLRGRNALPLSLAA